MPFQILSSLDGETLELGGLPPVRSEKDEKLRPAEEK